MTVDLHGLRAISFLIERQIVGSYDLRRSSGLLQLFVLCNIKTNEINNNDTMSFCLIPLFMDK